MYAQVEKTKENQSRAIANSAVHEHIYHGFAMKALHSYNSSVNTNVNSNAIQKEDQENKSAIRFVDSRPEAMKQQEIQESANQSDQILQGKSLQQMVNRVEHAVSNDPFSLALNNDKGALSGKQSTAKQRQPYRSAWTTVQDENSPQTIELIQRMSAGSPLVAGNNRAVNIAQFVKFKRFQGLRRLTNWFHDATETELLEKEKILEDFLDSMKPYENTPDGAKIPVIREKFLRFKEATIDKPQYSAKLKTLKKLIYDLDDISTRLAKRGVDYDASHIGETDGWVAAGKGGTRTNRLVYWIRETYSLLPDVLDTDKNKATIKDAILGDLKNSEMEERYVTEGHMAFAEKRVGLLRKNFKKMVNRVVSDWDQLCITLSLTGKLKYIHLTGSDFHDDGQSVSILESDDGSKAVYKPREITPDINLQDALNQPMGFSEKTDDSQSGEKYGYMEFLSQTRQLSDNEAKNYYYEMGKIVISSKLLGVMDLHRENILTGPHGQPLIVDAETSFLPHVMMTEVWGTTGIEDALTKFAKRGKKTDNFFYTDAELEEWQKTNPETTPDLSFVTKKRTASYKADGVYHEDFKLGISDMLDLVKTYDTKIIDYLKDKVKTVSNIRIVPVATDAFEGIFDAYHFNDRVSKEMAIKAGRDDVRKNLVNDGYEMTGDSDTILFNGLGADFENTDIPIFHFNPNDDHVYYRKNKIAKHTPGIEKAIEKNVKMISNTTVDEVVKALES